MVQSTGRCACVHQGASSAVRVVGARSADAVGRIGARGGLVRAWLAGWPTGRLQQPIAIVIVWTRSADAIDGCVAVLGLVVVLGAGRCACGSVQAAAAVRVVWAGAAVAVRRHRAGRGLIDARLALGPALGLGDAIADVLVGASVADAVGGLGAGGVLVLVDSTQTSARKDILAHTVVVGRAAHAGAVAVCRAGHCLGVASRAR